MKLEEYKKYKEAFCDALDSKRTENVFEIAETELRPKVGVFPASFLDIEKLEHTQIMRF